MDKMAPRNSQKAAGTQRRQRGDAHAAAENHHFLQRSLDRKIQGASPADPPGVDMFSWGQLSLCLANPLHQKFGQGYYVPK